ncbi:MAG: sugar phosphate isomerase/epimerase [Candidatus Adiutrix sp.]|jgi:sugar phosphate isomerase/epimerase|nr:sugar phosphate isomerase/epimerase [Candidatus Adiutrix sp.]
MNCYATLFLRRASEGDGHFKKLAEKRIRPEISFEYGGLDASEARRREVVAILKNAGLRCAVHLPYSGILPGASDSALWDKSVDGLCRAAEIAAWYGADHLIGHPEFNFLTDSEAAVSGLAARRGGDLDSASARASALWLERSSRCWNKVLLVSDAKLYLENTGDHSPQAIVELLDMLPERRAAMCFDVGHWFSAAGGSELHNLADWVKRLSRRLGHLHLHDNNGLHDQHLGMGEGGIDFQMFFGLLKQYGLNPTFTLEAHTLDSLEKSLTWIDLHSAAMPGNF